MLSACNSSYSSLFFKIFQWTRSVGATLRVVKILLNYYFIHAKFALNFPFTPTLHAKFSPYGPDHGAHARYCRYQHAAEYRAYEKNNFRSYQKPLPSVLSGHIKSALGPSRIHFSQCVGKRLDGTSDYHRLRDGYSGCFCVDHTRVSGKNGENCAECRSVSCGGACTSGSGCIPLLCGVCLCWNLLKFIGAVCEVLSLFLIQKLLFPKEEQVSEKTDLQFPQ